MNNNFLFQWHVLLTTILLIVLIQKSISFPAVVENPRALGGTKAGEGSNPWVISLQTVKRDEAGRETVTHDCGGAIIDEFHVVTAGHCVWDKKPDELQVVAGANNLRKNESTQQKVPVRQVIVHPRYTAQDGAGPNDIAILKLEEPFKFNENVDTVPRAAKNENAQGTCYSAGWGNQLPLTAVSYKGSSSLKTGKTTIVDWQECVAAYGTMNDELDTALCSRSGVLYGTCQGDSGGPLICYRLNSTANTKTRYLAGLVSFGFRMCNDGYHPDVYTELAHPSVYNFIEDFMKNGEIDDPKLDEKRAPRDGTNTNGNKNVTVPAGVKGIAAATPLQSTSLFHSMLN